jgi:hypothetical protein
VARISGRGTAQGGAREYVPEFDGNREAAAPDRVVVVLRNPTEEQRREWQRRYADAVKAGDEVGLTWCGPVVREAVGEVRGYEYTDADGVIRPIRDGAELAEFGEFGFVDEIAFEAFTAASLFDGEEKKS